MNRLRSEQGQTLVLGAVFMPVLIGMAALVLDVGVWLRADRQAQGAADATALAAAQALPADPVEAVRAGLEYAGRNGAPLADGIRLQTGRVANDTAVVEVSRRVPGFFSKAIGIDSVRVRARAVARATGLVESRGAAPIAVDRQHPKLQCIPTPCFDEPTSLQLGKQHRSGSPDAAGSFGLIDLARGELGAPGATTLGSWTRDGYPEYVGLGAYPAAPGASFNSTAVADALSSKLGQELLLPVYSRISGSGSNAQFEVIGWVGFRLTGFSGSGQSGSLSGEFTRVTWEGTGAEGEPIPDLGATAVSLVQ